jgi:hypothetical protein
LAGWIDALAQLRSFDHAACDRALRAAGVNGMEGFSLNRGSADSALYGATLYLGFTFVVVIGLTIAAWRVPAAELAAYKISRPLARAVTTGALIADALLIVAQAHAAMNYAAVCRSILHVR